MHLLPRCPSPPSPISTVISPRNQTSSISNETSCSSEYSTWKAPPGSSFSWFLLTDGRTDGPAMRHCCRIDDISDPDLANPIWTYADDGCYMWCEIPHSFKGTPENKKTQNEVHTAFQRCINEYNKDHNISNSLSSSGAYIRPADRGESGTGQLRVTRTVGWAVLVLVFLALS